MLTIKNFAKGDVAYVLNMHRGRRIDGKRLEPTVTEVPVITVGRQYVTVGSGTYSSKFRNFEKEYLIEHVNWGESRLLFPSEQAALDYVEKCDLVLWLGTLSTSSAEKYTLEQLRQVKDILSV